MQPIVMCLNPVVNKALLWCVIVRGLFNGSESPFCKCQLIDLHILVTVFDNLSLQLQVS